MINLHQLRELIDNNALLFYFSAHNCSVCQALKPKIQNSFQAEFLNIKQTYIDVAASKEITSNYGIFSFPTLLIFFEGKEFFRVGKNISVHQLICDVQRPYEMLFKGK